MTRLSRQTPCKLNGQNRGLAISGSAHFGKFRRRLALEFVCHLRTRPPSGPPLCKLEDARFLAENTPPGGVFSFWSGPQFALDASVKVSKQVLYTA